jgi:hypothetical protein
MNFFGHAALAADHFERQRPELREHELSRVCIGAMLPDFVGMLRLPRPLVLDGAAELGVAFHHLTDRAFHELGAFHELSRAAFAWLSERGMARGPARAIAHVGIEILLDEVMAADPKSRRAYLAALQVELGDVMRLEPPSELARLEALCATLLERGRTYRVPEAAAVALRIRRAMEGRPRLMTDDAGQALLGQWVDLTRPAVAAATPELLANLRARLAHSSRAS